MTLSVRLLINYIKQIAKNRRVQLSVHRELSHVQEKSLNVFLEAPGGKVVPHQAVHETCLCCDEFRISSS